MTWLLPHYLGAIGPLAWWLKHISCWVSVGVRQHQFHPLPRPSAACVGLDFSWRVAFLGGKPQAWARLLSGQGWVSAAELPMLCLPLPARCPGPSGAPDLLQSPQAACVSVNQRPSGLCGSRALWDGLQGGARESGAARELLRPWASFLIRRPCWSLTNLFVIFLL